MRSWTPALSPRTVKHLLVTLRCALAVAVKDGQIPRNVAGLVDPPRAPRPDIQAFSPEQARAFLEAVEGSRFEAAFTAAVAVGLRQGEILGLRLCGLNRSLPPAEERFNYQAYA